MSSYKHNFGDYLYWYKEGTYILHREDGPAIENINIQKTDYKAWYINGERHREDGPAREWSTGRKEWWYNGEHIKCSSQEEFLRIIKLKAFW